MSTMFPAPLLTLAQQVLTGCRRHGLTLATAESCTGGLIAACLTEIAGSSDVVERGLVTYSNRAKTELLGVPEEMLTAHGAVSEAVARAMAEGALTGDGIAIAVTGIAGPGGGSTQKPVGLVHLAAARAGRTVHQRQIFPGDRSMIRMATVERALELALQLAR